MNKYTELDTDFDVIGDDILFEIAPGHLAHITGESRLPLDADGYLFDELEESE